jgi:hypothetical protein
MTEVRKIVAHYLNGLAVAVLATFLGAALAGNCAPSEVLAAALVSALFHGLAVLLVRGAPL